MAILIYLIRLHSWENLVVLIITLLGLIGWLQLVSVSNKNNSNNHIWGIVSSEVVSKGDGVYEIA
jgi:hypothetical protein